MSALGVPIIAFGQSFLGTVGVPFSKKPILEDPENRPATLWGVRSLPAGLLFNENTGEITGTPTLKGAFAASFLASNSIGDSGYQPGVTLSGPPAILNDGWGLSAAILNKTYEFSYFPGTSNANSLTMDTVVRKNIETGFEVIVANVVYHFINSISYEFNPVNYYGSSRFAGSDINALKWGSGVFSIDWQWLFLEDSYYDLNKFEIKSHGFTTESYAYGTLIPITIGELKEIYVEFTAGWPASVVEADLDFYPVINSDLGSSILLLSAQLVFAPIAVLEEIEFALSCEVQGDLSFEVLVIVFESAAEGGMQADMFFEALCISGDIFLHSEIILIISDAVIYFEAAFLFSSQISAVMRTALGRGDWLTIVRLGGNEAIDIERESWVVPQRGGWGNQLPISRIRNLCPELGEEVADLEYQGRFVGPENEVPDAAPVGNRAGMPAPGGQWFAMPASRAVRHFDWEYCNNKPQGCQVVPSGWRHSAELVPYPHVFLQTNATGPECAPVNRLRNGIGPAMWISHFKGYGLPDFKLIAAVLVKLNTFICVGQMNIEPWVNPPSSWGPWEPSPNEICNGAEFTQISRDLNKLRRSKYRKAIGISLEDCEYGLPWMPSLENDMVDLVIFEGKSSGGALWFDENALVASALYLPVGENGASVFIG